MSTDDLTQTIIDRHDRHMSLNYRRWPIVMQRGRGCRLFDANGKAYIDLFAGFGASILGHCHPDLVRAVQEQAGQLWHVGNLLHTEPQARVAEAIGRLGFDGRSFFCHSGADANEAAIKLARLHGRARLGSAGRRFKVICAHRSFHGRTFGTMAAAGDPAVRDGFEPIPAGFVHVDYNDIDAVSAAIDPQTAAVMVEPIQGEAGVIVPDSDYLPKLRSVCDQHDLLLILDEVWTGCGRTGRTFAHQHWGIEPDIMTLGKGVGGGMAVGVMCAKAHVAELYDAAKQGGVKHATTLGGNCVAMAASAAVFEVIERDGLAKKARQLGDHVLARLKPLAGKLDLVDEVRGMGLFIAIELDLTASSAKLQAGDLVTACCQRGVLINAVHQKALRLAPPLVIDQPLLDEGLQVIEDVLKKHT